MVPEAENREGVQRNGSDGKGDKREGKDSEDEKGERGAWLGKVKTKSQGRNTSGFRGRVRETSGREVGGSKETIIVGVLMSVGVERGEVENVFGVVS